MKKHSNTKLIEGLRFFKKQNKSLDPKHPDHIKNIKLMQACCFMLLEQKASQKQLLETLNVTGGYPYGVAPAELFHALGCDGLGIEYDE